MSFELGAESIHFRFSSREAGLVFHRGEDIGHLHDQLDDLESLHFEWTLGLDFFSSFFSSGLFGGLILGGNKGEGRKQKSGDRGFQFHSI